MTLALTGSYTITGGSGAGSVKSTPISPFGLIQKLALERSPESFAGPLVLDSASLLHFFLIPFKSRVGKRTAPGDDAAGATYTIYGEMYVPFSFLDTLDTLLPSAGRASWDLEVTWPSSVGNARDAIYTGADGTFGNSASDPLRIEVIMDDVIGADVEPPLFEVAIRYDKMTNLSTGYNEKPLSVTPGERVPLIMLLMRNNSVRADMIGGPNDTIALAYGGADPVITRKGAQLAADNENDYKVRDGDRPTGVYFLDELKRAKGDLAAVPKISSDGGIPKVIVHSGSTAWTATADVEILSFVVRATSEGKRRFGEAA